MHLLEALPVWEKVWTVLSEGRSVLFAMPRYCRSRRILEHVVIRAPDLPARAILLDPNVLPGSETIDYGRMWRIIRTSLAISSRVQVKNKISFENALISALTQISDRTIFLVPGLGRGYETQFSELLAILGNAFQESQRIEVDPIGWTGIGVT